MPTSGCGDGLSCKLMGKDFQNRRQEIHRLFKQLSPQRKDDEKGIGFTFLSTAESFTTINDFVKFERDCCPFLQFEVKYSPANGPIILKIEAPADGQDFLRDLFAGY